MGSKMMLERIAKIRELSERGVDGEREAASEILVRMCRKYGVDPSMLDEVGLRMFTVNDLREGTLLAQIVWMVVRDEKLVRIFKVRGSRNKLYVELTSSQWMDVRECFEHYRVLLKETLDEAMLALFVRHGIAGDSDPEKAPPPMDERTRRIGRMAQGVGGDTWRRQARLEAGDGRLALTDGGGPRA